MAMDIAQLSIAIDSRDVKGATSAMDKMASAGSNLEGIVRKVAAAWASWEVFKQIRDVTLLAARYDTLGVTMEVVGRNAGYSANVMQDYQKNLEKTGISSVAARDALTMMAGAQLDLSKSSQLARVAQDAAVIGNLNSSESFQRMVQGIRSGQTEILRTIGINVNFDQGYKKLAETLGKTSDQLTDQEKLLSRQNQVLEYGTNIAGAYEAAMGTAGKQLKSMERYAQDLQTSLGAVFQPALAVLVDQMSSSLKSAKEWLDKNASSTRELGDAMRGTMKIGGEFSKFLADLGGGSDGASNSVSFLTSLFQGLNFIIAGTTDILRAFTGQFVGFIGFLVQKLGAVADLVTRVTGWSGKGWISQKGDSMQSWSQGIMAPLQSGNSALTTWYDSVFGENPNTPTPLKLNAELQSKLDAQVREWEAAAQTTATVSKKLMSDEAKFVQDLLTAHEKSFYTEEQWTKKRIESLKTLSQAQKAALLGELAEKPLSTTGRTVPSDVLNIIAGGPATEKAATGFHKLEDSTTTLMRRLAEAADSGNTFAIMGYEIAMSSGNAADALTRWSTNVDGLGVSWTTLGTTVRNVLADMIRQMERAIIQQKLMDPLIKWGISLIPTGTSGLSTSGVAPSGWTGMTTAAPPSGGGSPQANIVVHVNNDGTAKATSQGASKAGTDLAQMMEPVMNAWAIKQSRSGGLLARA